VRRPLSVELVWESKALLLIKYSGEVNGQDAYQTLLDIGADPRFDELKAILGDGSAIIKNIATSEDIEKMIAASRALSKSNPKIKNAIIMGPDSDAQTLISFYKFLSEDIEWEVEVFKSEQEARRWLKGI
jgi:hypothetical protein